MACTEPSQKTAFMLAGWTEPKLKPHSSTSPSLMAICFGSSTLMPSLLVVPPFPDASQIVSLSQPSTQPWSSLHSDWDQALNGLTNFSATNRVLESTSLIA